MTARRPSLPAADKRAIWIASACGLAVFVAGCLYAGAVGTPLSEDGCSTMDEFESLKGGGEIRWTLGAWPPGAVDCEFVQPNGSTAHATFVPVKDWLFSIYLAGVVGLVTYAAIRRTSEALIQATLGFVAGASLCVILIGDPGWSAVLAAAALLGWLGIRRSSVLVSLIVSRCRRSRRTDIG